MSYLLTRPWFWLLMALIILAGVFVGHKTYNGGSLPRNAQLRQEYASAQNYLDMARNNANQAMYDNAILAYSSALGRWPADVSPKKRAETMLSLADTLLESGRVKSDLNAFSQAYSAYVETQKIFTRKDDPEKWALAEYGAARAIEELASRQNPQYYINAAQLYKNGLEALLFPERLPAEPPQEPQP